MKHYEFSKVLLIILIVITAIISSFCIFFCFKFETTEPLMLLVPSVFTELAAATGFYYWKARSENKIKLTLLAIKNLKLEKDLTENQIKIVETFMNNLG